MILLTVTLPCSGHSGEVYDLAWSPDGSQIISGYVALLEFLDECTGCITRVNFGSLLGIERL